jgi:dolichol-phosphate mannosyltransferase
MESLSVGQGESVPIEWQTTKKAGPPSSQVIGLPEVAREIRPASDCLVVVPTYNERENIAAMIVALQDLSEPVDILIVDDNSPDGTAEVVRQFMQERDGIYLLQRKGKRGLGRAYKDGFRFALRHGWSYIVQMDADFSHNPRDVVRLWQECRQGAEVVLGSRYVGGGKIKGWPWRRWLLSRMANLYAQTMLGSRIADLTGGFKCFTRRALEKIQLDRIGSDGYIFQVEVNYRAWQEKLPIRQLPICFTDRRVGQSKMGAQEIREGLLRLWKLVHTSEKSKE